MMSVGNNGTVDEKERQIRVVSNIQFVSPINEITIEHQGSCTIVLFLTPGAVLVRGELKEYARRQIVVFDKDGIPVGYDEEQELRKRKNDSKSEVAPPNKKADIAPSVQTVSETIDIKNNIRVCGSADNVYVFPHTDRVNKVVFPHGATIMIGTEKKAYPPSNETFYFNTDGTPVGWAENHATPMVTEPISVLIKDLIQPAAVTPRRGVCKLCEKARICTMLKPCGHILYCQDCANTLIRSGRRLYKCPECEVVIDDIVTLEKEAPPVAPVPQIPKKGICIVCNVLPINTYNVPCEHALYCQKCGDDFMEKNRWGRSWATCATCSKSVSSIAVEYVPNLEPPSSKRETCKVCNTAQIDTVIIPCGDAWYCRGCADKYIESQRGVRGWPSCPACKASYDKIITLRKHDG